MVFSSPLDRRKMHLADACVACDLFKAIRVDFIHSKFNTSSPPTSKKTLKGLFDNPIWINIISLAVCRF